MMAEESTVAREAKALRLFWAGLASMVCCLLAYVSLPQTRWIPKAHDLLSWTSVPSEDREMSQTNSEFDQLLLDTDQIDTVRLSNACSELWKSPKDLPRKAFLTRLAMTHVRFRRGYIDVARQPSRYDSLEEGKALESPYYVGLVSEFIEQGKREEPGNAFWHICSAETAWALGDQTEAVAEIKAASECSFLEDYGDDEMRLRSLRQEEGLGHHSFVVEMTRNPVRRSELHKLRWLQLASLSGKDLVESLPLRLQWMKLGELVATTANGFDVFQRKDLVTRAFLEPQPEWANGLSPRSKEEVRYSDGQVLEAGHIRRVDRAVLLRALAVSKIPKDEWRETDEVESDPLPELWGSGPPEVFVAGPIGWLIGLIGGLAVFASTCQKWPNSARHSLSLLAAIPVLVCSLGWDDVAKSAPLVGIAWISSTISVALLLFSFVRRFPVLDLVLPYVAIIGSLLAASWSFSGGDSNPRLTGACILLSLAVACGMAVSFLKRWSPWLHVFSHATVFTLYAMSVVSSYNFDLQVTTCFLGLALFLIPVSLVMRTDDRRTGLLTSFVLFLLGSVGLLFNTYKVFDLEHRTSVFLASWEDSSKSRSEHVRALIKKAGADSQSPRAE